jgi:menaquinone-dependent protoporphyrinogen IX oxidase
MDRRYFFRAGFAGLGTMILTSKSSALKYYPKQTEKKCAVLYSTWCGSSRDAGIWISEGMGGIADVFDVRENPSLQEFEHVIIGGSIRSMATSAELQEYLNSHNSWLSAKIRGLFAVCGNMGKALGPQQTTMFIGNHLAKLCGVKDVPSKVFLGRVTKSLMDPQTAKMMSGFEDYDNLKRFECMMFGKEILAFITQIQNK